MSAFFRSMVRTLVLGSLDTRSLYLRHPGLQVIIFSNFVQPPSSFECCVAGENVVHLPITLLHQRQQFFAESLRPTTCLVGWLRAQLVVQDSCMTVFFSEPSDDSLEPLVSP